MSVPTSGDSRIPLFVSRSRTAARAVSRPEASSVSRRIPVNLQLKKLSSRATKPLADFQKPENEDPAIPNKTFSLSSSDNVSESTVIKLRRLSPSKPRPEINISFENTDSANNEEEKCVNNTTFTKFSSDTFEKCSTHDFHENRETPAANPKTAYDLQKRPMILGLFGGDASSIEENHGQLSPVLSSPTQRRDVENFDCWEYPSYTSSPLTDGTITESHVGRRVIVGGRKAGVLRYLGRLHCEKGFWCGVELDEAIGFNDGSIRGVRYFTCPSQHGILAPVSMVTLQCNSPRRIKRRDTYNVENSGPFSLLTGLSGPIPTNMDDDNIFCAGDMQVASGNEGREPSSLSPASTPTPGNSREWNRTVQHQAHQQLSEQSSIELDESWGILTPDQMPDNTVYTENPRTILAVLCARDGEGTKTIESDSEKATTMFSSFNEGTNTQSCNEIDNDEGIWKKKLQEISGEVTLIDQISFPRMESMLDSLLDISGVKTPERPEGLSVLEEAFCQAMIRSGSNADFSPASLRVDLSDRTLSPEDLPVDTPLQDEAREIIDGDQKTDEISECFRDITGSSSAGPSSAGPSSRSSAAPIPHLPPPSSSFVTSVTSITSLDNGYQGDGEWSRPASRGADQSPTGSAPPPCPKPAAVAAMDPMTDSDFFTESDADPHEEILPQTAATVRRGGDRRAQVIDGTLYGSSLPAHHNQHQRCPSFTASINEEMESSGVYSDLERRTEEVSSDRCKTYVEEKKNTVEGDFSPDGSTKTMSSRSEQSQVDDLDATLKYEQEYHNSGALLETENIADVITENNLKNQSNNSPHPVDENTNAVTDIVETDICSSTLPEKEIKSVLKTTKTAATTISSKTTKEENHHQLKKYKMPKRNVVSKIKAMIESSSSTVPTVANRNGGNASTEDENQENRRPPWPSKTARKTGRWDAVMNKIAQGQAEQKLKPSRLKEVKSKVFSNMGTASALSSQQSDTPKRSASTVSNQAVSLKSKSRRARTRTSSSSLHQQQQQQKQEQKQQTGGPGSPNSTPRSSTSDLSVSASQPQTSKSGPSIRSSKKRDVGRSASPLSDGSTNSATSNVITRPAANHLARPSEQKNGVSQVVDMKTLPVRKQPSRRGVANSGQKPTPLRDHNRLAGGGTVVKSEPLSKLQGANTPRAPPPGTPVATPKADTLLPQLKHAAAGFEALSVLVQYLVNDLDAFSTEKLKKEYNAMKAEWIRTKLDLEELQVSYQRIQDAIVDERTTHRKVLDELELGHKQALVAVEAKNNQEQAELVERYEAQLADYDKRFQQELEGLRVHYETEQSRLDAAHAEREAELLRDGHERLELAHQEHDTALGRLREEHKQTQDDLRSKLCVLETDNAAMKEQARKLMDTMEKDKDTKLQATAARCRELQDEVQSLQTVLELRHDELQELRRHNANLAREAEELPGALQRIAGLQARVEDLQAQLQRKASFERQLSQEHRLLVESLHQEAKQKNRLSLHNEELQWKLKQNTEVVNALAAMNGAAVSGTLQLPSSPACSSPASSRRSVHSSTQSLAESFSRTPPRTMCGGRPCDPSTQALRAEAEEDATSPPASPKIKGIVEKSDSVSWVLEIEESPEELVSRLMRRAGSFRGTTPPPSSSPSTHARTLPPPKRQRCKAASLSLSTSATSVSCQAQLIKSNGTTNGIALPPSSVRSRSRSVSADSMDGVDYMSWPTAMSTPMHHAIHTQRCSDEGNKTARDKLLVSVKHSGKGSLLKRCGDEVDVVLHDDELLGGESLCHASAADICKWNASASECSNDDSPTKSSSSSASSSSSNSSSTSSDGSIRSSGGGGGVGSDHEYRHCKKSTPKLLLDPSDRRRSLNLEADVLPLPPLPGSNTSATSDLSLLAACAAAQPVLMPKESAGEAMISEETSEDENDNHDDHDLGSSSDERSCSDDDDDDSSSESSSGLGLRPGIGAIRGLQASHEELHNSKGKAGNDERNRNQSGQQDQGSGSTESSGGGNQQYNLLIMSDSGSVSTTTTTTMDLSWSEDMELMPSETEGCYQGQQINSEFI